MITTVKTPAKILVVENEGIVALDNIQMLTEYGYEVVGHASTGEEAITLAKNTNPDLILMDINLSSDMDGIQAAEHINAIKPTAIIFVTAHAEEDTLRRAKLVKPFGYIIKPFESNELRATVEIAFSRFETNDAGDDNEDLPQATFNPNNNTLIEHLKNLPLFEALKTESVERLASSATLRKFEAGELILGPEQEGAFLLQIGRLNVSHYTTNDKELTIELLLPGDSYGFLRAFSPSSSLPSVRAICTSHVWLFPLTVLRRFAENEGAFWRGLAEEAINRLTRTTSLAVGLAHSSVEDRIISALIALSPRFGKSSTQSESIRLFITRRELADLTATTPETAIRVTKALERSGHLDLTKPGIIKIPSLKKLELRGLN